MSFAQLPFSRGALCVFMQSERKIGILHLTETTDA